MIQKIDHIGIGVKNLEEAVKIYTSLGLKVEHREEVKEQKVKLASLSIGESHIELLESTDPAGPIGKFVESRGEGIHHIAVKVDNIVASLENAKKAGIQLIDEKPRIGAGGAKIGFLHPKSTRGVLIEFCER
jgi:methylmalonyl-CoA/ethylmalonyl-CoA epimerase